jgi:hypothetical protein
MLIVPRIIWEVRSDVTTGLGSKATKLMGKEMKAKGNPPCPLYGQDTLYAAPSDLLYEISG